MIVPPAEALSLAEEKCRLLRREHCAGVFRENAQSILGLDIVEQDAMQQTNHIVTGGIEGLEE
jgi:hypothetical protein